MENQAELTSYNERTKSVVLQMASEDKKTGPVRVELRLRLAFSTQAVPPPRPLRPSSELKFSEDRFFEASWAFSGLCD
jgi:hypothetical protein